MSRFSHCAAPQRRARLRLKLLCPTTLTPMSAPCGLPRTLLPFALTLVFQHKRARLADTTTTTAEGDTAAASALPLPVLLERALVVHERQRQNPLLHYIAHVRIDFSTAPATDFVMSAHASALFLSLRYHLLRPDYIAQRIAALAPAATAAAPAPRTPLTLLLLVVDAPESQRALRELNALALQHGLTLIVCANNREAARYLETYRAYAHKSADAIKGSAESTPYARYAECVTTVRAVSSTDALTLAKQFGSLRTLITASPEQLVLCPGFGAAKVRQMQRAFTQPLRTLSTAPPLPRLLDKDKSAALPEPAAPAPMAKSGAAKRALLKAWATRARDAPQNTPQPRDEGGAASGNA